MMNEGMDTNAVVSTMMKRSMKVFLLSAASEPSSTPDIVAMMRAMMPILAEVRMPSAMFAGTTLSKPGMRLRPTPL